MPLLPLVAMMLALAASTGCSGTVGSAGTAETGVVRRSANTITAEELAGTGVTTVYDAIQQLRPQWLTSVRMRSSGTSDELQVYLDTNRYGTLESLRRMAIGGIQAVRFLSAAEATNRFGTGNSAGAIVVSMGK